MARDLGLHAMAIPEEYGGAGYGFREQSVVLEEMGRTLLRSPYLSTVVVAAAALLHGDDEEARARWLPRIAAGEVVATLAHAEPGVGWRAGRPRAVAVRDGAGWQVGGAKSHVVDGAEAGLLLVSAAAGQDGRDLVLLAVDPGHPGVTVTELPALDTTRRLASVTLDGVPAQAVATGERARRLLDRVLDVAVTGLACEQAGAAARALEMTVEYAKVRHQFGVPIGSFQAVQFTCADMLLHLEAARSAAYYAAAAIDRDDEDAPIAAAVAKAVCSDAGMAIAAEMVQIHGGIGYTWEHDAHLYFKRAASSAGLFGDADLYRERVATLAGV
ncbi:acyl-CoA dehydrogenase [Sphaerisporangium rufum]|uniref:Acyl-CoA dehydrogenase n=2 Tax=Sphaerisporangium rufum TaxID=1381558 RepID=A0A919R2L0_9ACTN|nr:acyl-CoA dehydrogenase [Sphaerisporangium rufum]